MFVRQAVILALALALSSGCNCSNQSCVPTADGTYENAPTQIGRVEHSGGFPQTMPEAAQVRIS